MNYLRVEVFACVAVAFFAGSCRKSDKAPVSEDGKSKPSCVETRIEMKNVSSDVEMRREERYKAEFERLVVSSNMTVVATERQASALCEEISRLPDKEYALRLYDRFLDMAIAQEVTETNLYHRAVWYEQLFYVGSEAFFRGQSMEKESFERWERFFSFLQKYTEEIVTMEKDIQKDGSRYLSSKSFRTDIEKRDYLLKFKGRLEGEIRQFLKCTFQVLSEGLSEEQKANVMHRLDEIRKKCMVIPLDFSSGKTIRIGTSAPTNALAPANVPIRLE